MSNEQAPPELTGYHKMNNVFATRNVANYASHLIPYLKPESKIIDVGCGIGTITMDFAKRVPNGEVIGIDINHESIGAAQAAAKEAGITNVSFIVGSGADLSQFASDYFDIAHAHQVMLHQQEPIPLLVEMLRVVKPRTGVVGIRDMADVYWTAASPRMEMLRDEDSAKIIPNDKGGRRNHTWMHQAGLAWEQIETGCAAWGFDGAEGRALWASGAKDSARGVGLKMGLRDEAFYDDLRRDWEEWAKNEEGKVMGLDGWVIGHK